MTFHGKYYDIDSAPVVTRPVQQPLVPWYATRTPDKARWCARLGLPMMALVPSPAVRTLTDAYRDRMGGARPGRGGPAAAGHLPADRAGRDDRKAQEIARRAFGPFTDNLSYLWKKFNVPMPPGVASGSFEPPPPGHRYAGDPAGARAWVAEHAATAGISYFSLEFAFGDMTFAEAERSAELFATEVMPAFAEQPAGRLAR